MLHAEMVSERDPDPTAQIMQMLESENALLRSEVQALHTLISDLQARLSQTNQLQCAPSLASQGEGQQRASLRKRSGKYPNPVSHSADTCRKICEYSNQCLSQWLVFLEGFILQVLPTFRIHRDGETSLRDLLLTYSIDSPIARVPRLHTTHLATPDDVLDSESQNLVDLLPKVDQALCILQQVVSAKLETSSILRAKLLEDSHTAKGVAEARARECRQLQAELETLNDHIERERHAVRQEVSELQQLYATGAQELKTQREDAIARMLAAQRDCDLLREQCAERQRVCDRLTAQRAEGHRRLREEEGLRARLIVELQDARRENELREQELAGLKVHQKVLAVGTPTGPGARLDHNLMFMIERLMSENATLRLEHERLATELSMAATRATKARYVTPQEADRRAARMGTMRSTPNALVFNIPTGGGRSLWWRSTRSPITN